MQRIASDLSVHHIKISNFKLKMTNPNHLIYSPCQTLIENQILYFLNFFAIFLGQEKVTSFKDFGSSNDDDFLHTKKYQQNLKKNKKNNFLQEFDMKNKLNGSDRSFFT
jgi:hypothetical protein